MQKTNFIRFEFENSRKKTLHKLSYFPTKLLTYV